MTDGEKKKCTCCSVSSYLMVWIAAGALGGSLAFHFSTAVFNARTRVLSTRYMIDTKTTLEGYSALMCDNLHVRAPTFQAYRLEGPPKPAAQKYDLNLSLNTDDSLPEVQSFYLNAGSEINVTMCIEKPEGSNKSVNTLVLKGDDAYNVWKTDNSATGGAYKYSTVSMPCSGSSSFNVKPSGADNYYLVIYNLPSGSGSQTVDYRVKYNIKFLEYDLSSAKLICDFNIHSCDVPLDLNTDQNVVLRFGNDSARAAINTSCTLRASMWSVFFGVLPGIFALLFTLPCLVIRCIVKVHDRREKLEMRRNGVL